MSHPRLLHAWRWRVESDDAILRPRTGMAPAFFWTLVFSATPVGAAFIL
jgi:hypothetical protein